MFATQRTRALLIVVGLSPLLPLSTYEAQAEATPKDETRSCRKDDDCRFAFRNFCQRKCPPCGEAQRKALNRQTYDTYERGWAIKVVQCRSCKRQCTPRWRGDRAVCRKSRCVVIEKGPLPLKSYVGARIGAEVYRLKMRWQFSMGRFAPADHVKPPRRYAAALQLHGLKDKSFGPQQRIAEIDVVLTKKEVLSPPGKGGPGRLLYHAEVTKLRWLGAPRKKSPLP